MASKVTIFFGKKECCQLEQVDTRTSADVVEVACAVENEFSFQIFAEAITSTSLFRGGSVTINDKNYISQCSFNDLVKLLDELPAPFRYVISNQPLVRSDPFPDAFIYGLFEDEGSFANKQLDKIRQYQQERLGQ
ncbi:MAG: hypothetical protein WBB28_01595 [Crinalium sp.]